MSVRALTQRRTNLGRSQLSWAWPLWLVVMLLTTGCAQDAADELYLSALRGEEQDLGRAQQITLIDQAIGLEPARPHYWETRAIYHFDLRQFDRAEADLDGAIAIADRPYLRFLRGSVRAERGNYGPALVDLDAAVAGQPDNYQFYRPRVLVRLAVDDIPGAEADAGLLVRERPQWAESYYARGRLRAVQGRWQEAIADYDQALQLRPELVYAIERRADAWAAVGQPERAAADRAAFQEASKQRAGCAACLDPLRY